MATTSNPSTIRASEFVTAPGTLTYPVVSGVVFAMSQTIQVLFGSPVDPKVISAIVALVAGILLTVLDLVTEEVIDRKAIIARSIFGLFNTALLVAGALGIETAAQSEGLTATPPSN